MNIFHEISGKEFMKIRPYSFSISPFKIFAVKLGLATAAVYYVKEQGIWKGSNESVQTYEKLKETVKPYVHEVKSQIPLELPTLPETDGLAALARQSWNAAVIATFKFITELPESVDTWTKKGFDKAVENEGVRNFIHSFSSKSNVESSIVVEKK